MKIVLLTQGKVTLVDDADYETVNAFKWHAHKVGRRFYASRSVRKPDGHWAILRLHTFLIPGAKEVDHEDGNGLNNQRYNLRPCTRLQNTQSFKRKRPGASSQFRGVSWKSDAAKWVAQINVNGQGIFLGRFDNELEAARAYDAAALHHFERPSPNFPI